MDKATLLAEVIRQVKELKNNANQASNGYLIPIDGNEVKVEVESCEKGGVDGSILYKASICCDYQPKLLSELKQTLDTLQLKLIRAELSTLGDRIKNEFVYNCCKVNIYNIELCQLIASNVYQALSLRLSSVLDIIVIFRDFILLIIFINFILFMKFENFIFLGTKCNNNMGMTIYRRVMLTS
jgi:hypothetical protein